MVRFINCMSATLAAGARNDAPPRAFLKVANREKPTPDWPSARRQAGEGVGEANRGRPKCVASRRNRARRRSETALLSLAKNARISCASAYGSPSPRSAPLLISPAADGGGGLARDERGGRMISSGTVAYGRHGGCGYFRRTPATACARVVVMGQKRRAARAG